MAKIFSQPVISLFNTSSNGTITFLAVLTWLSRTINQSVCPCGSSSEPLEIKPIINTVCPNALPILSLSIFSGFVYISWVVSLFPVKGPNL